MELLQLKYFSESAETENFSVVANKYLVPVSSVSSSVRKLEKELGCALFDRNKNKIALNKNGKIFYNDISTALRLINSAKEKISYEMQNDLGSINMLVKNNRSLINERLISFIKNNKNLSYYLVHKNSGVDYRDFDIIIDEHSNEYKGYRSKAVFKEKIIAVASKNNPLCKKTLVLNDLKHCNFITMNEKSSLGKIAKSVCRKAGFNPNIVIEDDSNDIIKYVEEDFGIAFLTENFIKKYASEKISLLNVVDFDYSRITYIYLKNNIKVSKAAQRFFDYMEGF